MWSWLFVVRRMQHEDLGLIQKWTSISDTPEPTVLKPVISARHVCAPLIQNSVVLSAGSVAGRTPERPAT